MQVRWKIEWWGGNRNPKGVGNRPDDIPVEGAVRFVKGYPELALARKFAKITGHDFKSFFPCDEGRFDLHFCPPRGRGTQWYRIQGMFEVVPTKPKRKAKTKSATVVAFPKPSSGGAGAAARFTDNVVAFPGGTPRRQAE